MIFFNKTSACALPVFALLFATSLYSMDILDAANSGNTETVKELIAANPHVVNQQNIGGWTSLYFAAACGYQAVVQILIANGANVNQQNNIGHTPLHYAALWGYQAITQILIDHGANVNRQDNGGQTPLQLAALTGHQNIVDLINRVNAASHRTNQQLLVLLCAGHRRLGAASPAQEAFQEGQNAIAKALAPFVRKAALEYVIYQQNQ